MRSRDCTPAATSARRSARRSRISPACSTSPRSSPIRSATSCGSVFPAARFASPSRRAPITSRPSIGCCRRGIGSPCSGSTGRAPGSRASTRQRSATTTSRAFASAFAPLPPRPGAASGSTSRTCLLRRSSGRYPRARIATRKCGCSRRAGPTRSGRASRRHVAPPACLSGRHTTSGIGGSASCTSRGRTWAEIGALVGQRSLKVTSDTYTHVLIDSRELDYAALLARP
jgi:hypothetical protein